MQNMRRIAECRGDIMRYHHDRHAFPVEIFNQFVKLCGHLRIQAGYRLIQQDDLACSAERPRKQDTLLLAAGKIAVTAVLQIFNCHTAHRIRRKCLFFLSVECPPAKPGLASGNYDLIDRCRKIALYFRLLGKVADLIRFQSVAVINGSGKRLLKMQERLHQGRLSRSVFTDNTKVAAGIHLKIQMFRNRLAVIAKRKVVYFKQCHCFLLPY